MTNITTRIYFLWFTLINRLMGALFSNTNNIYLLIVYAYKCQTIE